MPPGARRASALGAEPGGQERGEARLPVADGLVAEDEAPLEEHLREIAQAQRVTQPPEHDEQHQVGRVLPVVERRAGALVADPAAPTAAERTLPAGGASGLRGGRGRGTVRAGHRQLLHDAVNAATLPACGQPHQSSSDC